MTKVKRDQGLSELISLLKSFRTTFSSLDRTCYFYSTVADQGYHLIRGLDVQEDYCVREVGCADGFAVELCDGDREAGEWVQIDAARGITIAEAERKIYENAAALVKQYDCFYQGDLVGRAITDQESRMLKEIFDYGFVHVGEFYEWLWRKREIHDIERRDFVRNNAPCAEDYYRIKFIRPHKFCGGTVVRLK